jgi:glycosyltransferase involved in cell wall biosynthesis
MSIGEPRRGPRESIVVASFSGEARLDHCLNSLSSAATRNSAEIIVATNASGAAVARLAARFPAVQFYTFAAETTVFQLRSLGIVHARGQRIVLLEDHCTVPSEWLEQLRTAHDAGHTVVGGPIDCGETSPYAWALYLCEYSAYMSPLPEGPINALLAANTSYTLPVLWQCQSVWRDGFYDNEVHDALQAAGQTLYLARNARLDTHLAMTLRQAMSHLFSGGRRFGGYRKAWASPGQRVFWILAAAAVPAVLMGRIISRVWTRRRDRLVTVILGLPYLLCLLLAWSAGEFLGYLTHPASKKSAELSHEV